MCSDFMFDPVEFAAIEREWAALRERMESVRVQFQNVYGISSQPPFAQDVASQGFLGRAGFAVDAAHDSNAALRTYMDEFLGKLKRTASGYVGADGDNVELLDKMPIPGDRP